MSKDVTAEKPTPLPTTAAAPAWYKNPLVYFAGASAIAAAASAWAAWSNRQIAAKQAAITRLQYTPQLGLNIDQPNIVEDPRGRLIVTTVRIKNVGNITVFNAHVTASMMYLAPTNIDEVWDHMNEPDRGVTLAPTEEETLGVGHAAPTEEQMAEMRAGNLVLVNAGHINFRDDLGREHNRYVCGQISPIGDRFVGKFCPTPPQGVVQ